MQSFAVAVKQGFLETRRIESKSLNFTTKHYSNAARMDRGTAETLAERYDGEVVMLPGLTDRDEENAQAAKLEAERRALEQSEDEIEVRLEYQLGHESEY